jgi:hypothetical protein
MVVSSAGRPHLKGFIFGLTVILISFAIILYLFNYFSELTKFNSLLIIEPSEIPKLMLAVILILLIGIFGGFEIGRYAEANEKKAKLKSQTKNRFNHNTAQKTEKVSTEHEHN